MATKKATTAATKKATTTAKKKATTTTSKKKATTTTSKKKATTTTSKKKATTSNAKKKATTSKKKATAGTKKAKTTTTTTTPPKPAAKKTMAPTSPQRSARLYASSFASIYAMYVQKVERKGRTREELDEVIGWLTGYRGATLQQVLDDKVDLTGFFARATLNPNASLITGLICGVRIEDLEDPLMKQIRWLDKLVDELAQGRAMERILRRAG